VELEGAALALPAADADGAESGGLLPQLLLLSSGEISPFRLLLAERRAQGLRLRLVSDGFQLPSVEVDSVAVRK
jgi:general secretion pathway protein H